MRLSQLHSRQAITESPLNNVARSIDPDDLFDCGYEGATFIYIDGKFYSSSTDDMHTELIKNNQKLREALLKRWTPERRDQFKYSIISGLRADLGKNPAFDDVYDGRAATSHEPPALAFWPPNVPEEVILAAAKEYHLPPETIISCQGEDRGTLEDILPVSNAPRDSSLIALHLDKQKVKKLQAMGWAPKKRPSTLTPGQKLWALNSESRLTKSGQVNEWLGTKNNRFNPDTLYLVNRWDPIGKTFIFYDDKLIDGPAYDVTHSMLMGYEAEDGILYCDIFNDMLNKKGIDAEKYRLDEGDSKQQCVRQAMVRNPIDGVYLGRWGRFESLSTVGLAFWDDTPVAVILEVAKRYDLLPDTRVSTCGNYLGCLSDLRHDKEIEPQERDHSGAALHLDKQKVKKLQAMGWTPKARTPGLLPGQKLWALHSESSSPYRPILDMILGGHRVTIMPATPSFPESVEINQVSLNQYHDVGDLESVAEALGFHINAKKSLQHYNQQRGIQDGQFSQGFLLSYRLSLRRAIRQAVEAKRPPSQQA